MITCLILYKNNYCENNYKHCSDQGKDKLAKKYKIIDKFVHGHHHRVLLSLLLHVVLLLELVLLKENHIEDDEWTGYEEE